MSALDPTGLVTDTTDQILTAIEGDELATIDPSVDTTTASTLGRLNSTFAKRVADALALLQAIYGALDPNSALGQQLDVIAGTTGTKRKSISSTLVAVVCNLDAGHVYKCATRDGDGNVVSPGDLQAQIAGHPEYAFTCVGTAAVGDPHVFTAAIDTTSAVGPADYALLFECVTTGPIHALAGTLTVISPSVAGFNSATNAADEDSLGANIESDAALRIRRLVELTPAGGGTVASLRRSVASVPGVIASQILVNDGDVTDGNGLPPHSFACIVWDGATPLATNDDIAQCLWNAKPAGIKVFDMGSGTSGTAVDADGGAHVLGFKRATAVPIYIAITVKTNSLYPANGDDLVAAALVAFGSGLTMGDEIYANRFRGVPLVAALGGIVGVVDAPTFAIDRTGPPVNTDDLPMAAFEIPTFDTSRIVVSHA